MTQRTHLKNTHQTLLDSFHTARACHQRGDLAGAEAIYSQLLGLDPADDEVLFLFGALRAAQGDLAAGLECLSLAQQLNPANPHIPYTAGVSLQQAGRNAEACEAYQRCLSVRPDYQAALENMAAAYYEQDDFELGLGFAQQALALAPSSRLALRAVANCLTSLGRRAEALAVLDQAIQEHPSNPELHIHHAWELMANGRFEEGLREHEWRNLGSLGRENNVRQVPFPVWRGEPLSGKTLLVYGEAGLGDELMCAPYVRAAQAAGAHCILECDTRLLPLFVRSLPDCELLPRAARDGIAWDSRLATVDYAVSTMSLPAHFPSSHDGSPFLQPDPQRVSEWTRRLAAMGDGLKIGVSWRGGAHPKAKILRSIAPTIFGQLITPDAQFISLQYGASVEECAQISPLLRPAETVDALHDLEAFSALICALDLVISVDNSTIHFAGALGVPAWLLLPRYAEWRWGRDEADAARWYSGLRYFRQPESGEAGWRAVMADCASALSDYSAHVRTAPPVLDMAVRSTVMPPALPGRRALLLADTQYWYHWGCSCTSLGLHQGLREHFSQIETLPLSQILLMPPRPASVADLQSDALYNELCSRSSGMLEKIAQAELIVINGEGSIHGASPVALALLYMAYIAKTRFGKTVHIVNHSCFPGAGFMPDGQTPVAEFYAQVYRVMDRVVVREAHSLAILAELGIRAEAGFDCLPLFLASSGVARHTEPERYVVFGGSVAWTNALVEHFTLLAKDLFAQAYVIRVLSGAKAYLADDEVGFVAAFSQCLNAQGVSHRLEFASSEREWLNSIAGAALVVSGRFHYSVAAAFLQTPFLVAESNTAKISGLLDALDLPIDRVSVPAALLPHLRSKAQALLATPDAGRVPEVRLAQLRERAKLNFQAMPSDVPLPLMLRAYNKGNKGATAFFRNRPFLDTFCESVLKQKKSPCRVLVHASSVGAEPWSLALWWAHKILPLSGVGIEIFATDLDSDFLTIAQNGVYPKEILSGMSAEEMSWFDLTEHAVKIPDAIRPSVRFLNAMSFVDGQVDLPFDAVLIMNALTYVSPAEQSLALQKAAASACRVIGATAFHPDTIRADLEPLGFEPCATAHRQIHEAWGDRLVGHPITPGTPEYSWQLPPYDTETPDAAWRFASLFVR